RAPKGGQNWHRSTISDILRNPAYIGKAYYGKTERVEGFSNKIIRTKNRRIDSPRKSRKERCSDSWVLIPIPTIINEGEFLLAQEKLDKNQQKASRNTKEGSILQGLLVCGYCGQSYYKKVRPSGQSKRAYYCCSTRLKGGACKNVSFRQIELDDA